MAGEEQKNVMCGLARDLIFILLLLLTHLTCCPAVYFPAFFLMTIHLIMTELFGRISGVPETEELAFNQIRGFFINYNAGLFFCDRVITSNENICRDGSHTHTILIRH